MTTIKLRLTVFLVLLSTVLFAQTNNLGTSYYYLKDYLKAKQYFEKELKAKPNSADAYFYLGEIAFAEGDASKAKDYYNKGVSANPENAYNHIGLAKLMLKSDTKTAESTLASIFKKDKKNVYIPLAIGRAYLDNDMLKQAEKQVSDAKKINDKTPEIYILEGDIVVARKDGQDNAKKYGEAAGKYEMSNYFDPNYALGYVKSAEIYGVIDSRLAIEKLQALIEKQPDYYIAYSYLGKIYTQHGFYPQAIEAYKTYFNSDLYSLDDIERYARALYFSNEYSEANKVVDKGLQIDPNHFVLHRYQMYIDADSKDYEEGLKAAQKFFSLRGDASGYIPQDYTTYASILNGLGRYSEALSQFDKAIELEPTKLELYSEAATIAREKKDYVQAAVYLQKQMKKKSELSNDAEYMDDIIDINAIGYDYYSAGVTILKDQQLAEMLMKNKNVVNDLLATSKSLKVDSLTHNVGYFSKAYSTYSLNKADSYFDTLIERVPESYTGYRLKALTKHALNSEVEAGLALPYYLKVAEIIGSKQDDLSATESRVLLESYNYLGYYYYVKSDKPNAILYWSKVLELDPNNANAKLVLEALNNE